MKTFKFLMPCLLVALAVTGCDTDDLRNDVDELKNRVESLEAQVSAINENMNVLQVLIDGNKTIQSCTYDETKKEYKLVLSDGQELTLYQGENGVANTPTITIDETDNTWVVNGTDTNVPATGKDAAIPQFSVSEDGYWMVDYDGDGPNAAEQVKDAEGNSVKAEASEGGAAQGDTFFSAVEIADGFLKVTLSKGSKSYLLPIVEDLVAEIVTTDLEGFKDGVLTVGYGAEVKIPVKITGERYFVTAPAGWIAQLSEPVDGEATITLTAPAQSAAASRATADNSTDLTLQVNKGAMWAIDQIKVEGEVVIDSYYTLYDAGETIEIDGHKINKETYGDAKLITSNDMTFVEGTKVYFIEPDIENLDYTYTGNFDNLILIGNNSQKKSKFVPTKQVKLKNDDESGLFLVYNMDLDLTKVFTDKSVYFFAQNGNNSFGTVSFYNSDIVPAVGQPLTFISTSTRSIKDFKMENCKVSFSSGSSAQYIISLSGSTATYPKVTIKNNIFYCSAADGLVQKFKLFGGNSANLTEINIENNSFINIGTETTAIVNAAQITNIVLKNNIFYSKNKGLDNNFIVFRTKDNAKAEKGVNENNIAFNGANSTKGWQLFYSNQPLWDDAGTLNMVSDDPFTGGTFDVESVTFIPNSTYANYGAKFE